MNATSSREVLDTTILAIATVLAAVGIGRLIAEEIKASRAEGRRLGSLGWTLLWAAGLGALFVAAWAARG